MLENQEFKARKHIANLIKDNSSGKIRLVLKPNLEDEQIIHWAAIQILQPIFMRGMYRYSCGSIPDRGPDYGRKYVEKYIERHKADIKYVLKIDIQNSILL